MRAFFSIYARIWRALLKDRCSVCLGAKGGVRGNENVIDGKLVCDYCAVELLEDESL